MDLSISTFIYAYSLVGLEVILAYTCRISKDEHFGQAAHAAKLSTRIPISCRTPCDGCTDITGQNSPFAFTYSIFGSGLKVQGVTGSAYR